MVEICHLGVLEPTQPDVMCFKNQELQGHFRTSELCQQCCSRTLTNFSSETQTTIVEVRPDWTWRCMNSICCYNNPKITQQWKEMQYKTLFMYQLLQFRPSLGALNEPEAILTTCQWKTYLLFQCVLTQCQSCLVSNQQNLATSCLGLHVFGYSCFHQHRQCHVMSASSVGHGRPPHTG